jgi:hypothetical protein
MTGIISTIIMIFRLLLPLLQILFDVRNFCGAEKWTWTAAWMHLN